MIFLTLFDIKNTVAMGAVLYSFRFSESLEELKWDSKIQEKVSVWWDYSSPHC